MSTTASPPPEASQPPLKKPRRNPALSCQLCRAKKIKCDRNRPCANCVTRNAKCVPQDGEPPFPLTFAPPPGDAPRRSYSHYDAQAQNAAPPDRSLGPSPPPCRRDICAPPMSRPVVGLNSLRINESSLMGNNPSSGISVLSLVASHEREMQGRDSVKTANLFEEIAMGMRDEQGHAPGDLDPDTSRHRVDPDRIIVEPLRQAEGLSIFGAADDIISRGGSIHSEACMKALAANLPPEEQANELVANFFCLVHPMYNVTHQPSIEALFKELYSSAEPCAPNERRAANLALVYTILAVGAHFWPCNRKDTATGLSSEVLKDAQGKWRMSAMSSLAASKFLSLPTLEALQTLALLPLIFNNFGESETFRHLFGAVVRMAHTLGLHRLGSKPKPKETRIMFEVKRRIWYYIVASDWLESCHGGPRQGIFMINKKLMNTSLPSNCFDADLTADGCIVKDIATPTTVSYIFYRIELSRICYETIEVLGLDAYFAESLETDYDGLLRMDRRYHAFLKELPAYFRLDAKTRVETAEMHRDQPHLSWTRLLLNMGAHSMLIRLHRPFLISGTYEPRVAYSRMMCLRSARTVLKLVHQALDEGFKHSLRLWVCIHHAFMSAVILSIDLYCNEDEPHAEETRREVLQACALLEIARKESTIADQGLKLLHDILRRWKEKQFSAEDAQNPEEASRQEGEACRPTTTQQSRPAAQQYAQSQTSGVLEPLLEARSSVNEVPLYSELTDLGGLGCSAEAINVDWTGLLGDLDGGVNTEWQWWQTPHGFWA